jgi:hypothetical protein
MNIDIGTPVLWKVKPHGGSGQPGYFLARVTDVTGSRKTAWIRVHSKSRGWEQKTVRASVLRPMSAAGLAKLEAIEAEHPFVDDELNEWADIADEAGLTEVADELREMALS